nr:hypothetical protein Saspl_050514 [Ipomoea batatas]
MFFALVHSIQGTTSTQDKIHKPPYSNILQFRSLQVVFLHNLIPNSPFPLHNLLQSNPLPFFKSPIFYPKLLRQDLPEMLPFVHVAIADVESFVLGLGLRVFLGGNIALDILDWVVGVPGGSCAASDAVNLPWAAGRVGEREDLGEAVADDPVRGASATPPRNACISGETRRGFMIPRTGLFFVSDAGFEEAAKLTVRAGCRLAKGGAASLTEDGDPDGFNNVAVSPVTKPENIPKDRAIMPELWIG